MARSARAITAVAGGVAVTALSGALVCTQATPPKLPDSAVPSLPNPNPVVVTNFGALPEGRMWGNTAGVDIGPDGNVWAYDRCGTNTCLVDGKIFNGQKRVRFPAWCTNSEDWRALTDRLRDRPN